MGLRRDIGNRSSANPSTSPHHGGEYLIAHACFSCRKSFKIADEASQDLLAPIIGRASSFRIYEKSFSPASWCSSQNSATSEAMIDVEANKPQLTSFIGDQIMSKPRSQKTVVGHLTVAAMTVATLIGASGSASAMVGHININNGASFAFAGKQTNRMMFRDRHSDKAISPVRLNGNYELAAGRRYTDRVPSGGVTVPVRSVATLSGRSVSG
jgi:hypothetical protein